MAERNKWRPLQNELKFQTLGCHFKSINGVWIAADKILSMQAEFNVETSVWIQLNKLIRASINIY